ncbi:fumarate reductase/succinate dehydrogenase flavoprotein subunit [Euzebya sp.]|uniref:fumarate reductase/succinate dehydrogenase flavoprotein subunit n=1 Tax=Euzebya sp. TaxID=1971409 RepID=UPI003518B8EB
MTAIDLRRTIGAPIAGHVPAGDVAGLWDARCADYRLINPANRRRFTVIVVGTGLAGAGCAATLGELGYHVESFTIHDAPRRAHSVAAQGGINAARARKADGDSVTRFVKDTVKGGDFRAREADAQRLGELSVRVIDHLTALGVPFAREYGGALATRSFGGVQVSRTYYARSQTGQQLQIAGSQALLRQVAAGTVRLHTRHEMLDLIVADGRAQGIVVRDLVTGQVRPVMAHAVVLATGGYGNVYFKSTLAKASNATAAWRAHRRGALLAHPSFIQFHPTSLPLTSRWQSKTTLMSESLRNDGRVWVPLDPADVDLPPGDIAEDRRDYYLERKYPAFGNLVPRDVASRNAKAVLDEGRGVGPLRNGVYLDFRDAIARVGREVIAERYGNLFHLYADATGEDPWEVPMRIAPGPHFTMGGLWTDYDAMSSIPGLFVGGEASWAYHGANRLGANSLLSASVDGWFVLPWSIPNYLAPLLGTPVLDDDHPAAVAAVADVTGRVDRLLRIGGSRGPDRFHAELGEALTDACGVSRSAEGLTKGIDAIRDLRSEFWRDVRVVGAGSRLNQELERAGRVADYLELAELMCVDALDREESCGAHFRVEHVTPDGEAQRDDDRWAFASAWETPADGGPPIRHDEALTFSAVPLQTRSYT